jgi:hypothetical protein
MTHRSKLAALALAVGALVGFTSSEAHATVVPSCGGLDLFQDSSCQLQTSGGCTASCTPINFQAQCSANLSVSCNGSCSASADVMCTGGCSATCEGNCTTNPGSFTCEGDCEATCDGTCSGSCSSNSDETQCEGSCKASCGGTCHGQCTATPPSATCMAQCQASCSGSCTAEANVDCQVSCQANGYADCTASLSGGCTAQCSAPMGALFCDGQYVDVGGDIESCLTDLKNLLNIQVSASASCSGDECSAMADASASCAASPEGGSPLTGGAAVCGLVFVAAGVARRRNRKARATSSS